MTTATFLVGDAIKEMGGLGDGSVDLVLSSPPFFALRSYLPPGHPDKASEIGTEAAPGDYLDALLAVTAHWRRLLAPHGSIAVELGDTYAGSGGAGGDYDPGGLRPDQPRFPGTAARSRQHADRDPAVGGPLRDRAADVAAGRVPARRRAKGQVPGWPLDKSLCGIPAAYQLSLAYGRNVLTGEPSPAGLWRVRNHVAWVRPNPPVGALGDKFRPATSYIVIAALGRDRWFDLDAVRTPSGYHRASRYTSARTAPGQRPNRSEHTTNPAGAPPLDWWEISPTGYSGSHYAVYPAELCERPIEAMCPRRVCTTCGTPSRRVTAINRPTPRDDSGRRKHASGQRPHPGRQDRPPENGWETEHTTIGWTACDCHAHDLWHPDWRRTTDQITATRTAIRNAVRQNADQAAKQRLQQQLSDHHQTLASQYKGRLDGWHDGPGWRAGHVLDPFAGTGTTGVVATGRGRTATLIDLDHRNHDLARQRLGLFLDHQEAS